MHELLASPVCSDIRTLEVSPDNYYNDYSTMHFISDYLRCAGAGGKPFLRELHFRSLCDMEDVSFLADALLLGNGKESAPNLKIIAFKSCPGFQENIEQLGSRLFARGALASITTLKFAEVEFDKESMLDVMDGFRRSGHAGGTLQTLVFEACNRNPSLVSIHTRLPLP
jgi:hypothetical protein